MSKGQRCPGLFPSERRQADLFELVSEMNPAQPVCDLEAENTSLSLLFSKYQANILNITFLPSLPHVHSRTEQTHYLDDWSSDTTLLLITGVH